MGLDPSSPSPPYPHPPLSLPLSSRISVQPGRLKSPGLGTSPSQTEPNTWPRRSTENIRKGRSCLSQLGLSPRQGGQQGQERGAAAEQGTGPPFSSLELQDHSLQTPKKPWSSTTGTEIRIPQSVPPPQDPTKPSACQVGQQEPPP